MGLQRPVEPFHRPYSPPEPPAPARRPKRLLALLVAAAAVAAAVVAVFLVAPGERNGGTDKASVRPQMSMSPSQRIVTALPAACGTVSPRTVARSVPKATRRQNANSTLSTCTYTATGSAYRWLRVETHLYAPADTRTPVRDAEGYYDAQWADAHDAPLARTITLERAPGIGDEAYRWFRADEGRPAVIGQVTARTRNTVLTVSYSERAPAKARQDARERACLDAATAAAREVLTALNHF
ncbi:hypothetical protein E1293_21840 [Actinomadura darangshiensis]|uniref:DUF3558 domain-containing protein n=1 Tax=Actinomadura darangshiensis TaxID=705336 RepID=A0A4R5B9G3_9ACTN|nr:hypothetical protein [Actinomadura darangshiensis]TDD79992.1 hypothetical protein E1293_21840 [Actinomadura darangshiensis]